MFDSLGWGEIATLTVLALLVFGPERLPRIAAQAGRAIRQFRQMAAGVTEDLKREIGVDEDVRRELSELRRSLDPRRLVDEPATASARPAATAASAAPGEPAPFDPDAT